MKEAAEVMKGLTQNDSTTVSINGIFAWNVVGMQEGSALKEITTIIITCPIIGQVEHTSF